MKIVKYLIAFCCFLCVISCSKDNEDKQIDSKAGNIVVDAHEYHIWKYYKFTEEEKLEFVGTGIYNLAEKSSDQKTTDIEWKKRTDWDIAFNQYNLRTNSGDSGCNKGGICETSISSIADLSSLSSLNFSEDKVGDKNIILSLNSMPPPQASVSMSNLHPIQIIMTSMPPKYKLSANVFVLKTLNGLVGFKVNDFFNDKGDVGFIDIDYNKIDLPKDI